MRSWGLWGGKSIDILLKGNKNSYGVRKKGVVDIVKESKAYGLHHSTEEEDQ